MAGSSAAGMASSSHPRAVAAADDDGAPNVLSDLIADRSWLDALARVRAHPAEASRVIRRPFGDVLPLHEACKLQAPADVVEALIAAFPPAARTAAGQDGSSLPLHCAMETASTEALAPLLRSYPAGARKKDGRGRLPVHVGCEWRAPGEAVEALLVSYPECIYVRDGDGKSPMDYALNPRTKGDTSEIVAVLKNGPAYCAVSKSSYMRVQDEFDILLKNQVKTHDAAVAELERDHAEQLDLHAQMEEGYRSGLKTMGGQCDKLRRENHLLKKERSGLVDQLDILRNTEEVLNAHADALEERLREKTSELSETRGRLTLRLKSVTEQSRVRAEKIAALTDRVATLERDLWDRTASLNETRSALSEERAEKGVTRRNLDAVLERTAGQAERIETLNGAVASLSASLNSLLLPHDAVVARAKEEQAKALKLLLGDANGERYMLMGKVSEARERVLREHLVMEDHFRGARPAAEAGVELERYVPSSSGRPVAPEGGEDRSVGSALSAEEKAGQDAKTATAAEEEEPVSNSSKEEEEPALDKRDEDTEVGLEDGVDSAKKRDEADDATVEDVTVGNSESEDSSLCVEEVKSSEDQEASAQDGDAPPADEGCFLSKQVEELTAKEEEIDIDDGVKGPKSTFSASMSADKTTDIQNRNEGEETDTPGEDDPVNDDGSKEEEANEEEEKETDQPTGENVKQVHAKLQMQDEAAIVIRG